MKVCLWHLLPPSLFVLLHPKALSEVETYPTSDLNKAAQRIVQGARKQLQNPAIYDPSYRKISYPGGDVPLDRGVCTDVVIRAFRNAGYDLQKLVHEDMKRSWKSYFRKGKKPDSNIDHRRVPNQVVFFKRYGLSLTTQTSSKVLLAWKPGDVVYWKLDNGLDHVGVLSDRTGKKGLPLVIHNLSRTAEEDVLEAWKILGHYRFPRSQKR